MTSHLKNEKDLFGPSAENLICLSGLRRLLDSNGFALATIASEKIPSVLPVNMNKFHASHEHEHDILLRFTAKQLGVVIEGTMRECEGCSVFKSLGKPI